MKVQINENVLEWIMSHGQIERLSEKNRGLLESWVNGENEPTFAQIKTISKGIGIPFGYFFLQKPPQEEMNLLKYRTVDSFELKKPSRDLIETIHDMEMIQDWTKNEMIRNGEEPLSFVGAMKDECDASVIANYLREMIKIQKEWYSNTSRNNRLRFIKQKISESGVLVMSNGVVGTNTHRPLSISEFRAFAMVDKYAPLVFINSKDSANAKIFSLIHEVAHVLIGEDSLFNSKEINEGVVSRTEQICNAVAAEILVPDDIFTPKWKAISNRFSAEEKVERCAVHFRGSEVVVTRRAFDHGFIDKSTYYELARIASEKYSRKIKSNEGGGDYYNNVLSKIDHRFLYMLNVSVKRGETSYTDAFRLTNTNNSSYGKLMEKAEVL